jgi:hypothetical protein
MRICEASNIEIPKQKKPAVFRRRLGMTRKASVRVNLQSNHTVIRCGHYTSKDGHNGKDGAASKAAQAKSAGTSKNAKAVRKN